MRKKMEVWKHPETGHILIVVDNPKVPKYPFEAIATMAGYDESKMIKNALALTRAYNKAIRINKRNSNA